MEEAAELGSYLPLSFKTRSEQEYVAFLWDVFDIGAESLPRQHQVRLLRTLFGPTAMTLDFIKVAFQKNPYFLKADFQNNLDFLKATL